MRESREKPGLPATLTLASALVVAVFLLLLAPVYLLTPTVPMPDPLPPNHQTAETLLYGIVVAAALLAALFVPNLAARWSDRHSPGALGLLAAIAAGGLGAVVGLARLAAHLPADNLPVVLALAAAWWVAFLLVVWRGGQALARLAERPGAPRTVLVAACCLVGLGLLSLVDLDHVNPVPLVVCLALAALGTYLWGRIRLPALSGWKGRTLDVALVLLVLVAAPDVTIYRLGDLGAGSLDDYVISDTMVFHANLYLGAANEILHGNYLLVDEVSQYGVGLIYALAALFEVVPLDYGTLSFTDGVLSAVVFALGYLILRMVGIGRTLAVGCLAVTVVVLAWGLTFPLGGILQNGALRFGLLPVSLIFLRLAGLWLADRDRGGPARVALFLSWCVAGLSAVWALEALLYTTAAVIGLVLAEAMARPAEGRWRWVGGQALRLLAAWAVVHVAFAVFTLVASGELPDWGMYVSYLREFLGGNVGQFTYDFQPWTPALAVGLGCLCSLVAVAVAIPGRPEWFAANRLALIALAGLSAYGVVQFSYFANRSLADVLPYLCFPLLLCGTLWLGLLLRSGDVDRAVQRAGVGVALVLAAVAVSTVWPDARHRADDTVLAYGLPGGKSLRQGLERLGDMPPIQAGAAEGQRLVEEYMPGEEETAVLTTYDLDLEVLFRTGRVNRLGIADAKEASWVQGPHLPVMEEGVASMGPGDRMLVDEGALEAFARLQKDPDDIPGPLGVEDGLVPIQLKALSLIGRSYDLKTVAEGTDGLSVVELVPKGSAGSADELAGGQDPGAVQDQPEPGP